MVKPHQINLSGPSRSNLSHHLRSAQSMEVEGTTTSVRMLGGLILLDLTRGSQRRMCTLEFEQGQSQEQEQLLVVKLSDAASPQVRSEPLDGHVQIDCDMIKAHGEVVYQVAGSLLTPFNWSL